MSDRQPRAHPLGIELRRLRIAAGLSMSELSRLTHYSKGHLSKVETGVKSPSMDFARRVDAALAANGRLIALVLDRVAVRQADDGLARDAVWSGSEDPGLSSVVPEDGTVADLSDTAADVGVEHSLKSFRMLYENMRDLGQVLGPSSLVPMLSPHAVALRELARRVDPSRSREALILAARFAEYTGWMTQEMGDDVAALRWTDQAVELAREASDQDMVAYAYVRRANIALYQQDSYGTVSFARQAQAMECGSRVKGLAVQREAQGHALAGDYEEFRRCLLAASKLLSVDADRPIGQPVLGPTKIPDTMALAEGWSLHDLGRSAEAVEVLSGLLERTPKAAGRAWARIGARLALALASIREIDRACAIVQPILVLSPVIESATIRADLRQFSRIINRWSSNPSVRGIMPDLSAALTPTSDRPSSFTALTREG